MHRFFLDFDNGEPGGLVGGCGDMDAAIRNIGESIRPQLELAIQDGEDSIDVRIVITDMNDSEVEALPVQ